MANIIVLLSRSRLSITLFIWNTSYECENRLEFKKKRFWFAVFHLPLFVTRVNRYQNLLQRNWNKATNGVKCPIVFICVVHNPTLLLHFVSIACCKLVSKWIPFTHRSKKVGQTWNGNIHKNILGHRSSKRWDLSPSLMKNNQETTIQRKSIFKVNLFSERMVIRKGLVIDESAYNTRTSLIYGWIWWVQNYNSNDDSKHSRHLNIKLTLYVIRDKLGIKWESVCQILNQANCSRKSRINNLAEPMKMRP